VPRRPGSFPLTVLVVLVAHASAATRRRLCRPLRAAGHEVIEAGGAQLALTLCRERLPDVLLLAGDLCTRDQMPVVELVKADPVIYRTAIVLIEPAGIDAPQAEALLRRGAHDFLVEPVREAEVLARVQAAGRTKVLQEELLDQTARLEVQLFEDPLTQLKNRRFLFSQLRSLISGARRHGRPMAVAMIDLDRFKAINDAHGHAVGDEALVAAADALRRALRAEDVLGRIGGEEFLALLPDTDDDAAARAAERLRAAVEAAAGPVPLSASVGYAVLEGEEAPDDLVRRADGALYAAKRAGRNTVRGPATLPRRT
jgi:two-component system cell cycle response regulator